MKEAEEKQIDQYTRSYLYEDVFTNIPIATAIVSNPSKIVAVNVAFQNFFRLSDSETALPISFEDISSSFWKKQDFQQHLHFVMEGKGEQTENVFDWQHEDGTLKYVQLQSQLLSSTRQSQAKFLLTFCDVSIIKQIEKEHYERIRHMMHELRNPLSNISLCVELLADSTKENNQEDTEMFLTKASTSVQRMKQIINDLNTAKKTS